MRTKTVKRTGQVRQVKAPVIVIDDKKLAEFVASRMYKVTLSFNLRTFECETEDLKSAILQLKTETPVTEMYISIQKGQALFEKRFNPVNARKLFNDEQYLDMFLNTFNSLYHG